MELEIEYQCWVYKNGKKKCKLREIAMMVVIHMQALPAKRRELLQTLQRLMNVYPKEPGFVSAQLWMSVKDRNDVTLCVEWETRDDIDRYLRQSEYYCVLLGAQQWLTASSKLIVDEVSPPEGMGLIYVVPHNSEETYDIETFLDQSQGFGKDTQ